MFTRSMHRLPLFMLAFLALVFVGASVVSAHGKIISSIPAAGSTVATAPKRVLATFDNHDALQANGSLLKVTDASGTVVDQGDTSLDKADADRKTLAVSLKNGLGNGSYTVAWTAASSVDGSKETGNFTFTVGAVSTSAPATLPTTGGNGPSLAALLGGALALVSIGALVRQQHLR